MNNLSFSAENSANSPFDLICCSDAFCKEFWLARDLMPLLGYSEWSHFKESVQKAIFSCRNTGSEIKEHFAGGLLMVDGRIFCKHKQDYKLSRYGAYLAVMNCDPRRNPKVAAAQAYFAAKCGNSKPGFESNFD